METFTSIDQLLASSMFISHRLQDFLAPNSLLLFHRSQWRCLATSYSSILHSLSEFLEQTLSSANRSSSSEEAIVCHMLSKPLYALYLAVEEGEKCMRESIPGSCSSMHSWLVNKALPQSMSTDVVDIHLHDLLWIFSVVCEMSSRFGLSNGKEVSFLSHLAVDLFTIWEDMDFIDDFCIAQRLLRKIKDEEQASKPCSELVDFVLKKLEYHVETVNHYTTPAVAADNLPPFLWVASESLLRNPDTLGVGGYGKVYEARWLEGHFAIKDFFYVENNQMFGREAAIQAQLHHPHVIPLVCCTKSPALNKCSLVMELMQQDLQVLMMQRMVAGMGPPFSLVVAVDLMLQIAKGMEYLHSLRIIHRDLKSSNILVSFSSRAGAVSSSLNITDECPLHVHLKVADFGMSKAKYASSRYTSKPIGTREWRAPELFEANPEDDKPVHPNSKYTNKADVYSFALVCYEILTGKPPFEGTQIRRRVLAGERPRLPHFYPSALTSFIEACWHAEPTLRPSFTQICRMLRYFKACVFLQDVDKIYNNKPPHADWLSSHVSSTTCACIDDLLQSLVQRMDSNLRPQSDVILIPLVMYCCRSQIYSEDASQASGTIYEQIGSSQALTNIVTNHQLLESQRNGVGLEGVIPLVMSCCRSQICREDASEASGTNIHEEIGSSQDLTNIIVTSPQLLEGQRNGVALEGSISKGNVLSRWLRRLSCLKTNDMNSITASSAVELKNGTVGLASWGGFTYSELCIATNNFSHHSLIGCGQRGEVYLGMLVDGRRVAVKRKNCCSACEGLRKLRIASVLRHQNIVPLIGWCQEAISTRGELLLVYEYMPNGDLSHHIFEAAKGGRVVAWRVRYKVVCQLAAALKYLHQDWQIVHRDVKTSSILLDSEWNARLGDCGTALLLGKDVAHELLVVSGTLGYHTAPETITQGIVSSATDIYAFGITVFEIVTGRKANRFNNESDELQIIKWVPHLSRWVTTAIELPHLSRWVRHTLYAEMRRPASLVDERLAGVFNEEQAEQLLLLGMACTHEEPDARPDIHEVLTILLSETVLAASTTT